MDRDKLPRRALIDTGVLIRALDKKMRDDHVPACRGFWEAMLNSERRILIAAPTLAEFLRKPRTPSDLPAEKDVEIVAFDRRAATLLGQAFPSDVFKKLDVPGGVTRTHLKYDAMIVACALRWKAESIVSLDPDFESLCASVGMVVRTPDWFQPKQLSLPSV